jgi:hypothetical protein
MRQSETTRIFEWNAFVCAHNQHVRLSQLMAVAGDKIPIEFSDPPSPPEQLGE